MAKRSAPYQHSDGSNCWTKNCSRGNSSTKGSGFQSTPLNNLDTNEKVDILASGFHQQWQHEFKRVNGQAAERWKTTKDQEWVKANGTDQVDIANTSYGNLPADWQGENKAAAEFIVKTFVEKEDSVLIRDSATRNRIGSLIHNAWLERNSWAKGSELDVPFENLTKEEQDKDIQQYNMASIMFFGRWV